MNQRRTGKVTAKPAPLEPDALVVTYETARSRKVIHIRSAEPTKSESAPHGAGGYHDPDQHMELMDRVESMLRASKHSD